MSGSITDFYPKSGSLRGGTIVTIEGQNFDFDPQNNPVNIGYEHCEIISSSPEKIVLRTPDLKNTERVQPLIVGLKASEEA